MRQRTKRYTREYKLEAVRLAQTSEKTYTEIEEELGITRGLLSQWVKKYTEDGEEAFPGKGKLKPEEERIRELERENVRLRQERDVLKKVLAIFSRDQR
jgi:transposase